MIQTKNINYKRAYSELNEILKVLSQKELESIPAELIKGVEENRDMEYEWKYDASKELLDQELMTETKALIVEIYESYLCPEDEKDFWNRYDKRCLNIIDEKKKEKYSTTNIFRNKKNTEESENLALIVKKDSLINKAIRFIKEILNANTAMQE